VIGWMKKIRMIEKASDSKSAYNYPTEGVQIAKSSGLKR
jgi:hypothetical protein